MTQNRISIPDKAYFSIGEVSEIFAIRPHVLRYWEQEFSQLRPAKRRGNRRYYRRSELQVVREIRRLLYDEGLTIPGARAKLINVASGFTVYPEPVQSTEATAQSGPASDLSAEESWALAAVSRELMALRLLLVADLEQHEPVEPTTPVRLAAKARRSSAPAHSR